MGRLLPAQCLDARHREVYQRRPTDSSANIPFAELKQRRMELPRAGLGISIADTGPEARSAQRDLEGAGHPCELVQPTWSDKTADRFRLWSPPAIIESVYDQAAGRAVCFACGTGREAVALAALGWHVVAIDLLPDAIERARQLESTYLPDGRPPIDWQVADLRTTAPLPELFDLVVQLFYCDPATSARVGAHLRPGGAALLEAFAPEHWRQLGRNVPDRLLENQSWPIECEVCVCSGIHDGRLSTQIVLLKP